VPEESGKLKAESRINKGRSSSPDCPNGERVKPSPEVLRIKEGRYHPRDDRKSAQSIANRRPSGALLRKRVRKLMKLLGLRGLRGSKELAAFFE
jgi:hypothetical protein